MRNNRIATPPAVEPMDILGVKVQMRYRNERFRPDFPIPQPDGSTMRQTRSWPTKKEAEANAERIITNARKGIDARSASTLTVDGLGRLYLQKHHVEKKHSAANTLHNCVLAFSKLSPYIGSTTLSNLSTADVNRTITSLSAEGLGVASVKNYVGALTAALNWTMKQVPPIVSSNVAHLADLPDREKKPRMYIPGVATMAEIIELQHSLPFSSRSEADPLLHEVVSEWLAMTGARIGECVRTEQGLGLDLSHIDRDNLTVTLYGKTRDSYRTISLDEDDLANLDRLADRWLNPHHGPVFVGLDGQVISGDQVRKRLRLVGTTLGLPESLHPHLFRHYHASRLLAAGLGLHFVKERLGHANINITSDLYGHLETADGKDQIAAANAKLRIEMRRGAKGAIATAEEVIAAVQTWRTTDAAEALK